MTDASILPPPRGGWFEMSFSLPFNVASVAAVSSASRLGWLWPTSFAIEVGHVEKLIADLMRWQKPPGDLDMSLAILSARGTGKKNLSRTRCVDRLPLVFFSSPTHNSAYMGGVVNLGKRRV